MAKKLNQQDLLKLTSIGTPPTDSVAFAAKSDGLYQKVGTTESKLSTTAELLDRVKTPVPREAKFTDTVVDISGKVDKVTGKGLSTNDYTSADKVKLNGIAEGANKYVHPTAIYMTSAERTKLAGIATEANKYSLPTASGTTLGGIKVGSRLTISSGTLSANVQSDNNFTTALKNKLDGIAAGATNLSLGTSSTTAYRGDRGNAAYTHISDTVKHITAAERTSWNNKYTKTEVDNKLDILPAKEAYLQWGGRNLSGNYSPIDAAMVPTLGANRAAFIKPEGVTIEYTRDGGTTWIDYGSSDASKIGFFTTSAAHTIGKSTTSNPSNGSCQLRVTINTGLARIYTALNKFVMYVSTSGSQGSTVTIEKALESTPTNFINTNAVNIPISGYSGYNVINTENITTYGNSPASQYGRLRFTFKNTSVTTGRAGLIVYSIFAYGGVGWTTPSTLAKSGLIYSFDTSQNVTFPSNVKATSFTGALSGNATTATRLQNARTIGGVSFNGTANINLPGVNTAGNQNTSGTAAKATILANTRAINGTNFNGSAAITTARWGTARTLSFTGDVTGTSSVNGSENVATAMTLANVATAGTYKSVTINTKGLVTAGTNPTTLSGYGITDAVTSNATQTISGGKTFSKLITANAGISTTTLTASGIITATGGNSTNWNTAYGWGNHADKNYLTSYVDTKYTAGTGLELLTSGGTNTFSVKLSDSISTNSSTTAATSNAVRLAYNRGSTGITNAVTAQSKADSAYTLASGKEDKFTKNGAFNKNFGTAKGTVAQGNDSRINNGQTAFGWGNHALKGYATETYVDNIEIGGRNYISGNGSYSIRASRFIDIPITTPLSGQLTLSASRSFIQGTSANSLVTILDSAGSQIQASPPVLRLLGEGFSSITFSISTLAYTVRIYAGIDYPGSNGVYVDLTKLKLEKGNKPTDWTPAPEDQVSNWSTTDVTSFSYIKNKPTTLAGYGITALDVKNTAGLNSDTLALGRGSEATSTGSVALGMSSSAYGLYSLSIRSYVEGNYSIGIGGDDIYGDNSVNIGGYVEGDNSVAIGGVSYGDNSVAIGKYSLCEEPNTGVLGTNGVNGYGANKWIIPGNLAIGKNTSAASGLALDVNGVIKATGINTPKVDLGTNWKIEQVGTELVFKYNNVIKQRMLSDGSIVAVGELTAITG